MSAESAPLKERPSARLLVLDPMRRVLLFRFEFEDGALAGKTFWATPGGALDQGDSFEAAANRELQEETGIATPVGAEFARKTARFQTPQGDWVEADERYFVVRVDQPDIRYDGHRPNETRYMTSHRWWPLDALRVAAETVYPEELVDWLETLTGKSATGHALSS